ncbi:facilitated trehalose transporter Tret1-like isoform X1 [Coccinella septempunctata]|uniref:facilitated trehalose transporter Tret1-like isoform X1 n=1 Tax=Coccinella septempunctata TaxID=41139 RepID=UPI001D076CB1|nr:facilitated trehalose transporter Tret1-like isoform X1 [Coccinella septempunctata]
MAERNDHVRTYRYTEVSTDGQNAPQAGRREGNQKLRGGGFTNSVLSIASQVSSRKLLYFAACIGNLAAYTCGISFGWTSPEIPKLKADDSPLETQLTPSEESWIGSLLPIGAAIGPFFAGVAADKIGRKNSLLLAIIPFIIAFAMAAFAKTVLVFLILRVLFGLGVGIVFTVLPMYIGEIADDDVRGQLGSFMQLFITIGLTFSYAAGPYVDIKTFNFICLGVPVLFLFLFFFFVPESPYYLIQVNKPEEAEKSLIKLRSGTAKSVKGELEDIRKNVEEAKANKAGFMDIFATKGLTKAFIISLSLVFFQQFSGINVIIFYAQDVFAAAGSKLAPEISAILIGVVQILSSGATPILVERSGKRLLLLISATGMTLSLTVLAYYFYLLEKGNDVSNISWLPIVSLISFIIVYCLGFGPLPWAVMGELFPGNVKSIASTCTASACWIMGFLITKYFTSLAEVIHRSGCFGLFSLFCLGAANFVLLYLPETTGKSLQEIQDLLNK